MLLTFLSVIGDLAIVVLVYAPTAPVLSINATLIASMRAIAGKGAPRLRLSI